MLARILPAAMKPASSCALVTRQAQRVLRRADHLVRGRQHGVIAVALDACAVEDLAVRARRELRREDRVTRAADVADRAHARRRRAVVAVAVVARRRREVVLLGERVEVHALLVIVALVGRQWRRRRTRCIPSCARAFAVAARTEGGDVGGEHRATARRLPAEYRARDDTMAQVATF